MEKESGFTGLTLFVLTVMIFFVLMLPDIGVYEFRFKWFALAVFSLSLGYGFCKAQYEVRR